MAFGSKEYNKVFEDYKKGQKWLNDIEVEIVGGEAEIDPLVLLRIYDAELSIDNELTLASGFCLNRAIRFFKDGQLIHEVFYKGGSLGDYFQGRPYLLDILLKMSYGLMLKKLTPPSENSETEERQ
jgi:hypothetical protein